MELRDDLPAIAEPSAVLPGAEPLPRGGGGSNWQARPAGLARRPHLHRVRQRCGVLFWRYAERFERRLIGTRPALAMEPRLVRGLVWLPRSRLLLLFLALAADARRQFADAAERWGRLSDSLPDLPMPRCRASASYRHAGLFHLANEVMERAAALFPDDLETVIELAVVSVHFDGVPRAAQCWIKAVALSDGEPVCVANAAQMLLLLGRFQEASELVVAGRARHPDDRSVAAVEAMLAASREDWPAAVSLWTAYHERYPEDTTGWEHLGRAVAASRLASIVEPGAMPVALEVTGDPDVQQLLLRFQSIGDNCEFGLVQRRFGAEPLGLLRWNRVEIPNLVAALDERFAGMGQAENVTLEVLGNKSYFARDRRWDLGMHTFQFAGQIDHATLHARMCRRVAYLRDKFLADLGEGQTTFVYRSDRLSDEQAARLFGALRRHGPARLLVVRVATEAERPGEVRLLEDNCWLGLTRRAGAGSDLTWDIPFDDWLEICRRVPD